MFKRNQIQKTIIVAGVTLSSCVAFAQQTETTTATVTVQNAFTLTEVAGLSFGTITASAISGATSSIVLLADGTAGTSPDSGDGIRVLAPGTPASYTIAAAAPFTDLKASVNVDSISLSNAAAPAANPDFTVGNFTISNGTAIASLTSGALAFTTGTALTTDVNGALALSIGGTLTLPDTAEDTLLVDGAYTGQFTLTVQY